MNKAIADKQLLITVNNEVGTLAEVSNVIASAGINMIAICAYAVDNKGIIMFVSENNVEAKRLLKAKKYDIREEEVVLLAIDNKPGALQAVTDKIANEGIDLTLIYGSVDRKAKTSPIVLVSEDNEAVLKLINLK